MLQSTWLHWRVGAVMLDGLIFPRMILKARPCQKLTGMIDVDLILISLVSASHQFSRILDEVIIFTIVVT